MPDTLLVPTVLPPLVQLVGALDRGPNTLKVIVPVGEEPPESAAEIDAAEIVRPYRPPSRPRHRQRR